jgi:hypothetical protein
MKTPFDELKGRGSMFATFTRHMLIQGYKAPDYQPIVLRTAQEKAVQEIEKLGGSIAETTVSIYTAQLKKMGLFDSVRMPKNRRHFGIVLTDLGFKTLERLLTHNPKWGETLEPANKVIGLDQDQRERLLDELLAEGFYEMEFVEKDDRKPEDAQRWRVLYDEYAKGTLKIVWVESHLKVRVYE